MASAATTIAATTRPRRPEYPIATTTFTWAHTLLGALFVAGICVDLWAHNNIRPLFETFFTPWHGLLYGGFAVMGGFVAVAAARNYRAGYAWTRMLPRGYGLSLLGAAIFSAGGAFDLIWHTLFGIEADLDALVSPSHLILVLGAVLMLSGPIGAAAARANGSRWSVALATLAILTVVLPFFELFAGPFGTRTATGDVGPRHSIEAVEILSTLVYSGFIVGALLLLLRVGPLPVGSGLLIVGGTAAIMTLVRSLDVGSARVLFLVLALVAGLLTDALLLWLRRSPAGPRSLRIFAGAVPAAILTPYLVAIAVFLPVTWSAHALFGTVVLSVAIGVLLGIVATPSTEAQPTVDG